jgi:prepilin-type N-terminal cleavage/methylation domain-containing protein
VIQYFKPRSAQPKSQSGFTLIEVLVIVIIIAVLSAIAAPGWLAFMNNRRVSTARGQVSDLIRKAQTDAKTTRTMQAVLLDDTNPDPGNSQTVPRIAVVRCLAAAGDAETCDFTGVTPNWISLGNGDIQAGTLKYTTTTTSQTGQSPLGKSRLVFDSNGLVKSSLSDKAPPALGIFVIGFQVAKPAGPPRCLVVQTLIGSLREGNSVAECGS